MNLTETLKATGKLMIYYAIFFVIAGVAGYYSYSLVESQLMRIFQNLAGQIYAPGSMFQTALNIFLNNLLVTLLVFLTGFTLVFPVLVVGLNGFLVGFVTRFALIEKGLSLELFLKAIIAHSIFELPAIFLAASLGTRVSFQFYWLLRELFFTLYVKEHEFDKEKVEDLLKSIREGIALFLLIVLPLLLAAAFLEVYVSGQAVGLH